ncbi:hypothetical protein CCACVL1_20599 [Corchorus capsularis]|uniref:Uncharacterized protein n=1 Tax=Corchorus capsularis TaxID=210143 RepID=A0A1R3HAH6_COCAP|nr:hypothetical protein CCACVL1_20599 [Corchorus capsularis]
MGTGLGYTRRLPQTEELETDERAFGD